MSLMVAVGEGQPGRMTADDIIAGTRQVVKGLEALRSENRGISQQLQEALIQGHGQEEPPGSRALQLLEEKYDLVRKSLEGIELGLGEAKVPAVLGQCPCAAEGLRTREGHLGTGALAVGGALSYSRPGLSQQRVL